MNSRRLLVREIEIDEAVLGMREDGILQVFLKDNMELDAELQLRWIEIYHELTGGVKVPFIFQGGIGSTVTREARDKAIEFEDRIPRLASAVVVTNTAHALIANFFLKFNKPSVPYRVFKDFDKAIEWLKKVEAVQTNQAKMEMVVVD